MSYSFTMQFGHVRSWEEALTTAADCAQTIRTKEIIRKGIKDGIDGFARHHRGDDMPYYGLGNWAVNITMLRFVCWPQYNLLGYVSSDWTEPHLGWAFAKSIHFQNSTDQDYDYREWAGSPYFNQVVDKYKHMPLAELLRTGMFDDYTLEELSQAPDYYSRSAVYKQIFKDLCLDDWLYGRDNPAFRRFVMGTIQTSEELQDAVIYAKKLLADRKKGGIA